ncbi:hypothetical protein [Modestobacter sp. I12A-02662]|uniref:hypothetical protein n=1 Tax=Modestobacter sp. I12A-02662 TaxID=1730496 RepID=UPI0034E00C8A
MTLTRPTEVAAPPVAAPPAAPVRRRSGGTPLPPDWYLRLVSVFVVVLLVLQRIGVSVGGTSVSIAVPLAYAFLAVSIATQMVVVSRVRAGLLTVAVSALLLTTAAVSIRGVDDKFSLTSLALLVVLYLPWAFCVRGPYGAAVVARAGRTFLRTMLVLSVVGMAQLSAQLIGVWEHADLLELVVPSDFRIPMYNYDNEVSYGVDIWKSASFVLLEPSFLSQFCALAILIGILLRVRAWQLLILAGGLASAVSGTGLVLLGVGGGLLLLRAPRLLRPSYVVVGAFIPVLLYFSPVGTFLLERQGEFGKEGTSGNARFNLPFQAAWNGLMDDPVRFFIGAGPGAVDRVLPSEEVTVNGTDVLYSTVPKLVFEYGLLAGGLFILFLVLATIDRAPWRVIPAAMVFMTFVLSGALLQPQTAVLVWLLAGLGAAEDRSPKEPSPIG